MAKYCTKCGNQCDDQVKYCPNCGTALQMSDETKKQTTKNLIISGVVYFLLLVFFVIFLDVTNLLEDIADTIRYVIH